MGFETIECMDGICYIICLLFSYIYVLHFSFTIPTQEVDLGLAADLGTLQRFPKIIGNDSLCRELVYTGRKFTAEEAKDIGFVR